MEIEKAFKKLFESAEKIKHWHDSGRNNEGMVVSADSVRELWKTLDEVEDVYNDINKSDP